MSRNERVQAHSCVWLVTSLVRCSAEEGERKLEELKRRFNLLSIEAPNDGQSSPRSSEGGFGSSRLSLPDGDGYYKPPTPASVDVSDTVLSISVGEPPQHVKIELDISEPQQQVFKPDPIRKIVSDPYPSSPASSTCSEKNPVFLGTREAELERQQVESPQSIVVNHFQVSPTDANTAAAMFQQRAMETARTCSDVIQPPDQTPPDAFSFSHYDRDTLNCLNARALPYALHPSNAVLDELIKVDRVAKANPCGARFDEEAETLKTWRLQHNGLSHLSIPVMEKSFINLHGPQHIERAVQHHQQQQQQQPLQPQQHSHNQQVQQQQAYQHQHDVTVPHNNNTQCYQSLVRYFSGDLLVFNYCYLTLQSTANVV